jgi:hypothetical protein
MRNISKNLEMQEQGTTGTMASAVAKGRVGEKKADLCIQLRQLTDFNTFTVTCRNNPEFSCILDIDAMTATGSCFFLAVDDNHGSLNNQGQCMFRVKECRHHVRIDDAANSQLWMEIPKIMFKHAIENDVYGEAFD